jgi:hypothetical protein
VKIILPKVKTDVLLGLYGQPDIFQYGEGKEDIRELERPSDTQFGPKGRRKRCDVLSFKENPPFRGPVLPGDHIEEGGLSRSIRSDNRLESERKDLDVYVIDGDMTTESNGKVFCFNEWSLNHIVRKYFYEIPPRLPFPKGGEIVSPLGRMKKDYPPL